MVRSMSYLVAAALVLSSFGSLAFAKPDKPAKSPEERFSKLDKDGDKKLSLEEFIGKKTDEAKEKATKRFAKLDSDSDKSLSLDEFKAGAKPKA